MLYGNSWLETILILLISVRIIESKSRLVGEPSDRRLSSLVRRALVGLKICFLLNVTA
ncbi:NADH dehydrogenase subunit 4 [Iris pallida]|uniref:NADH dehydrogenase subunit 4 (Mitochondrion) n=1 Tax=Iris pallida TaxID=29817 RepID=A0AAX6E6Y1_IRIPA|nr:NADH dehydrogenase subunit 4 [Iris pallida]